MDILDKTLISQYRDVLGHEVFMQNVDLYKEQAVKYFLKLEQAIELQSYPQWQENCHILKSASGNTGLKEVYQLASDLEYSQADFSELSEQLMNLIVKNDQAIKALEQWLNYPSLQ
ncbi:hypothetical protein FE810_02400 [Thalassotalea litorea]|uniref:HPt domain-containing protein n=1 Tax=Thalassotalea litorea TaxID=2020715 RepID=A0A5R9IVF9_9GAMM|nr:Hpt domain-containing protein [Thalassotalea litorea]TLU67156.1 hypothetical protein FE810_02400 [Thalassotalea litorea]